MQLNKTKEKENIKHILTQSVYAMCLLEAAIRKRDSIFVGIEDQHPLYKFFAEKGSQLTTHMAVISLLYNFIVIPKELILEESKYSAHYEYIKSKLLEISKIIHSDNEEKDLLRRLRNSLAHANFILENGGFTFHDENTNGSNKIKFHIEATKFAPLIDYIQNKIVIPFINEDINKDIKTE